MNSIEDRENHHDFPVLIRKPIDQYKQDGLQNNDAIANAEPIIFSGTSDFPFLTFPLLSQSGVVTHGFSTRLGGVSKGQFAALNFGYKRGDDPQAVIENYRRMGQVLQIPVNRMVAAYQTHTTNIRIVTEKDAGKGIVGERDYKDIDGLITNVRKLALVTFYADCVPLFFLDPIKQVIGLSHSGWRGTVSGMGKKTVEKMTENFGCKPSDILACIGPSICAECYEVGEDVAREFKSSFSTTEAAEMLKLKDHYHNKDQTCNKDHHHNKNCLYNPEEIKYELDLWKANYFILRKAGILDKHIAISDICTCCNPDVLFSHRASKGKRGNLAAFMAIR